MKQVTPIINKFYWNEMVRQINRSIHWPDKKRDKKRELMQPVIGTLITIIKTNIESKLPKNSNDLVDFYYSAEQIQHRFEMSGMIGGFEFHLNYFKGNIQYSECVTHGETPFGYDSFDDYEFLFTGDQYTDIRIEDIRG